MHTHDTHLYAHAHTYNTRPHARTHTERDILVPFSCPYSHHHINLLARTHNQVVMIMLTPTLSRP